MTADPRTHGVGTGDVVDVVVRGRVSWVSALSLRLEVETDPRLSPVDVTSVGVTLPAECIVSAVLAEPTP